MFIVFVHAKPLLYKAECFASACGYSGGRGFIRTVTVDDMCNESALITFDLECVYN